MNDDDEFSNHPAYSWVGQKSDIPLVFVFPLLLDALCLQFLFIYVSFSLIRRSLSADVQKVLFLFE